MCPAPLLDAAEVAFFADLQRLLSRKRVRPPKRLKRICAVDSAYDGDRVVAVASVFEDGFPTETSSYAGRCSFPYVSGLFYLREGPFVVRAVRKLKARPQLVCFDAHGAAHPRGAGLATVCGMVLGIPSIGCAKSLLVGEVVQTGPELGKVIYDGEVVGLVTRLNGATRYWSPGYSVSFKGLESLVKTCGPTCLKALSQSDRVARSQLSAS